VARSTGRWAVGATIAAAGALLARDLAPVTGHEVYLPPHLELVVVHVHHAHLAVVAVDAAEEEAQRQADRRASPERHRDARPMEAHVARPCGEQ